MTELRDRVLSEARREPSLTRDGYRQRARRGAQAAIIATLLVFLAMGGMHTHGRPAALVLGSAALWGGVALGATWLGVIRGGAMLGRPPRWLLAVAGLTPVLLSAGWWVAASILGLAPDIPDTGGPALSPASSAFGADATCFGFTLVLAIAPLIAFLALRPEGDPVSPASSGAALGAAAGAWAGFLMALHCERADPHHVVLAHVIPVAVIALVGALVGRQVLAVRQRLGRRP